MRSLECDLIDSGSISLDDSLRALVQRIATNNHEEWAARKRAAGFVFARAPDGPGTTGSGGGAGAGGASGSRRRLVGLKGSTVNGRRVSNADQVFTTPLLLPFSLLPGACSL